VNRGLAGEAKPAGVTSEAFSLERRHSREFLSPEEHLHPTRRAKSMSATEVSMVEAGAQDHVQ
jgi:hypothetical protein